ncbi:MAG: RDD family protein [Acidobacteria bacterium]|nr:RDD family protein [Acidobacteriota bacterium]
MTEREWHSPIVDDEIAEPWRRLVGFVIDWMILVMIALLLVSVLRIDFGEGDALRLPASVLIVQGLVAAAYYIGFTVSRGQTPGKMLIGTRVVMERTGQIPGFRPSAIRWVVPGFFAFLPGISVVAAVIYGWLVFDSRRRGLHDKAAKTVVVHAR